ncbi:TPA: prophage tail fiber N-terminal domain-containing protein, partial [Serratia fonticola]|nr:prophage tail fiber N-terminal domain-containing protein [Serratia fonticola]HBE9093490.1 prophage tail fiber N-terminal domain-containing protein [Serratia fonticola]
MAVISGVLKGPMGDALEGVVIELRALRTSATVITQERSSSVTNSTGRYTLTVEPGDYSVFISAFGRTPENRGSISVKLNSVTGTLNDFLLIPGETDLNPAIVATVDQMRADAAASAAAAKVSADTAAETLSNTLKKGDYGLGGASPVSISDADEVGVTQFVRYPNGTSGAPDTGAWAGVHCGFDGASRVSIVAKQGIKSLDMRARVRAPGDAPNWGGWAKLWHDQNLINPLKVGDYGLGGTDPILHSDASNSGTNSFTRYAPGTPNAPGTGYWAGLCGGYDNNSRWYMSFGIGSTITNTIAVRGRNSSGVFSPWSILWHSGNTTVDANGFIKKASPIVKLFGTGESELNDQSQGVTTERVSEGVYRVSG